jgi:hypothetical protein
VAQAVENLAINHLEDAAHGAGHRAKNRATGRGSSRTSRGWARNIRGE